MIARQLVIAALLVAGVLLVWWLYDLTGRGFDADTEAVQVVTFAPPADPPTSTSSTTTTPPPPTTVRARTAPIRPASVGRPEMVGVQCGGDLPPCWVLRRESGGDPRIWNGRCYMPVGSTGKCGRSSASGLWQVIRSTWAGYAGFVNAADAPVVVQNDFARMLWAGGRGCAHWSAC